MPPQPVTPTDDSVNTETLSQTTNPPQSPLISNTAPANKAQNLRQTIACAAIQTNQLQELPAQKQDVNNESAQTTSSPVETNLSLEQISEDISTLLNKMVFLQSQLEAPRADEDSKNQRITSQDFRERLNAIYESDGDQPEKLKALRTEIDEHLKNLVSMELNRCSNLVNSSIKDKRLTCKFGEHSLEAHINLRYEIDELAISGNTFRFSKPVSLTALNHTVAQRAVDILKQIEMSCHTDGLEINITGPLVRFKATLTGQSTKSDILITPLAMYQVIETAPESSFNELNAQIAELEHLARIRSQFYQNGSAADRHTGWNSRFSNGEEDDVWLEYLENQTNEADKRMIMLERECGTLTLAGIDDPKKKCRYEPGNSSDQFSMFEFNANGEDEICTVWERDHIQRIKRFQSNRSYEDVFDQTGRELYREVYSLEQNSRPIDVSHHQKPIEIFLYDKNGRLLDREAQNELSPENLAAVFVNIITEAKLPVAAEFQYDACISAGAKLLSFPNATKILALFNNKNPELIFGRYEQLLRSGLSHESGLRILKDAAYRLGDVGRVNNLIADSQLSEIVVNGQKVFSEDQLNDLRRSGDLEQLAKDLKAEFSGFHPNKFSHVELLSGDPALQGWREINPDWLNPMSIPEFTHLPSEFAPKLLRIMVARNLYLAGKAINEESVCAEVDTISKNRELYSGIKLFEGRNVLIAAHSELIRDVPLPTINPQDLDNYYTESEKKSGDVNRFGKNALSAAIREQQNDGNLLCEQIRPDKTEQSLKNSKMAILARIRTLPPPATFIFDGHGLKDAWYLFDGQVRPNNLDNDIAIEFAEVNISTEELSEAFKERAKNFPQLKESVPEGTAPVGKDIVILDSCFSSNLARSLFDSLGSEPKPIILAASEYSQLSYSELESPFGSILFHRLLDPTRDEPTSFRHFFEHEWRSLSEPALYIPDEDNQPRQISQSPQKPSRIAVLVDTFRKVLGV